MVNGKAAKAASQAAEVRRPAVRLVLYYHNRINNNHYIYIYIYIYVRLTINNMC